MKILFFVSAVFCLLGCFTDSHQYPINFVDVDDALELEMKHFYDSLFNSNKLFGTLVTEINKEDKEIYVLLSKDVGLGGMRVVSNGKVQLIFSSIGEFMDENMLVEEFFHAFQFQYYGISRFTKDESGEIIGASNIEYEAKLFKALLNACQGKPFNETPSQKGLVGFVLSLLNEKGELSDFKLTEEQHEEYIKLVKFFQQHWKARNKNEGKTSFYDHPVDTSLAPEACFYILAQ